MYSKDERMSNAIGRMITDLGRDGFRDPRKTAAIVADYITDNDLADEKTLLKRVVASGAMTFLATTPMTDYFSERQKAFYLLTEREFISSSWAEKALNWFDAALGQKKVSQDDGMDIIQQMMKYSMETEEDSKTSSHSEFLSPIDMLLDEDNNDNIIMYNENNEKMEFEQIALVPIDSKTYAILKPALNMPGIADDEALVFVIDEVDDEDCLVIVEDDGIVDAVFEEYYKMLRDAGIDVD